MKKILFVLSICTVFGAFGQLDLQPDTVYYEDKTGGTIDTFDISNGDLPTTFENGHSILSESGMSSSALFLDYSSRKMQRLSAYDKLKFSALPHLGFAYSFGGQGAQFVRLDYSQAFNDSVLLNFKYDRNTGLGSIQRSNFTENNLRLQFQSIGKRFSFDVKAAYRSFNVSHPGGIAGDSTSLAQIENFGLEFSGVNKSNASSIAKVGEVNLKNYINLSPDSLNHFGITTHHHYSISNREYLEVDEINGLNVVYDTSFIDSTNTRDQFNWARIRNAGGVYYSNRKNLFYLDGLIEHGYWQFQNLGQYYDTTEIGLVTNARIKIKQLLLTNQARLNFIGAFNEWSEEAKLRFDKNRMKVKASFLLKNAAPDPFIRKYNANNFQYQLSDISNQLLMRVGGGLDYVVKDSVLKVGTSADFSTLSSLYLFDGTEWSVSNQTLAFTSIKARANWTLGNFNVFPTVVYSISTDNRLPTFQAYTRVFMKGKLFKAKRLEALVGVDASYISSFNRRSYIPALDVMDMYLNGGSTEGMFNLHAFASFGIQEFRFFVRYENIGYFWNSSTIFEMSNYPISGTRLRVGLTWDFFN